ncbi:MAG: 50S ribosomal protein L25 [Puniceicoccales bacterium]|jgi:large subunit ribosomal protein L25|nr:50S ribosomal protein L25 [Puniceicoccales bacterium]
MKQLQISIDQRSEVGRHSSYRLRRKGRIPAVVYGKSGVHLISVLDKDLRVLMKEKGSSAAIVELGGEVVRKLSIVAEVQREAVSGRFMHVDFHEISENEKIHLVVPIKLVGESYGVKNEGAIIEQVRHELGVRCLPKDMMEHIIIDVSNLKVGNSIHIKDISMPKGVELIGSSDAIVLSCVGQNESAENEPSAEEPKPAESSKS